MSSEFPALDDLWTSFSAHLDRAWIFLNDLTVNPDTYSYVYAALDLRFAIERLLTIALWAAAGPNLLKHEKKLYRPKDFEIALQKHMPNLNEVIKRTETSRGIAIPELDLIKINEIYGVLGNYLHEPRSEFSLIDDESWKDSIEQHVLSAYDFLDQYRVYDVLDSRPISKCGT